MILSNTESSNQPERTSSSNMISSNKIRKHHSSSRKTNHYPPFIASILLALTLAKCIESLHEQQSGGEHSSPSSRLHTGAHCPKTWILMGQKCYKISPTSRNYERAKQRCNELTSEMTTIEDDSFKEKETTTNPNEANSNILAILSNSSNPELKNRQYYVNLSAELQNQYRKKQNSSSIDEPNGDNDDHDDPGEQSELWLPSNDPSVANLAANIREQSVGFVLAFSSHLNKWGIVPVAPTKRMQFICEQPPTSISPIPPPVIQHQPHVPGLAHSIPGQQQSHHVAGSTTAPDPKRTSSNGDLNDQPRSISISYTHEPPKPQPTNQKQPIVEKEQPDTVTSHSMLFRDEPVNQSVVMGSTAEMRCSSLESESTLYWLFEGRNLTQSNRIKSFLNGTLKIDHVRSADAGNYTCVIHSGGSTESKSARLELIERPYQLEYITAELLDKLSTSVRVKWTPGFNGNSPIKKYLVEMRTVNSDNIDNDLSSIMQSNQWEVAKANISADQTSVIIPDLKPARKYIFRIAATNKVGTGDPSLPTRPPIEVPVQPPSLPPENLTGTAKSSTSIMVQWAPPPAESHNGVLKGYKIRHKLAHYIGDADWYTNDVPDTAHLTFVLDDLIMWQEYEVQVAAENDKGVGPFGPSILVKTKEGRPDKGPRSVSAEAISPTAVRINWLPPPPQQINGFNRGYKVQVWYDPQHNQLAKDVTVSHNTYMNQSIYQSTAVDNLLPYTTYHITVKCFTNAGDGPPNEDPVTVKTKQDFPEAIASIEFADVLDKSLRILWQPPNRINGELDHYTLEYSETSVPDKRISKRVPAGVNEIRITELSPQTSYTFKIFPHTNVGPGPGKISEIRTSVPPVLPEPPTNLVASNVGPYSALIHFNPGFDGNASIEKWIAEALSPSRGGDYTPRWLNIYTSTNHSKDNSVLVRNLRPFTKYRLRLRPVNVVGPSIHPSDPTTEFQTAQEAPEQAPRDLMLEEVKSNSAVAHWSPLANNQWLGNPRGYNLTWSEVNTSNSTIMHYLINDTRADTFYVRDLEEFTDYSFRIYAVNDAGSSPSSENVVITTQEDVPSSGPTNLTAHAISSTTVQVDWNAIPKRHRNGIIRGYRIQYQAPDAPLQQKTVEDNSTRQVTLKDLKAFTTYRLAVAAFTSIGDGVYSAVLNVQTLEDTPGKPQNLSSPTVSQTSARILWDPPEDPNGDILGYKVSYHALTEGSREVASHELHPNERTFKAANLKGDTHYVFTVTAKTKEGWGQQASILLYTYDSELRANLPFYRESWFVILCASLSFVITVIITALLFIQTKSYKYKQDAIKSTSHDRLGDAGLSLDDDAAGNHYNNNGFGLLSAQSSNRQHRRSIGGISQSTDAFTLPKTPTRPNPGSVVYSDDGDDDVFEDMVDKQAPKRTAGTSNYNDSSGDSMTEKPSEISSSTAPESESPDDEYVNMANKHFVNHYANVNGTLRGQKAWKKSGKTYSSHRTKPKLPQRPAPSVPKVPGAEPSSSSSDNAGGSQPMAGTSGMQQKQRNSSSIYGESQAGSSKAGGSQMGPLTNHRSAASSQYSNGQDATDGGGNSGSQSTQNAQQQQQDLLNGHIVNLNGGRIIVDNMAGSRAPLPGFTSFV